MKVHKIIKLQSLLVLLSILGITGCYYDNQTELYQYANLTPCDTTQTSYATDVVSIINTHCTLCHSQGNALGGGIFLANYAQVKTTVDDGTFYGSITHQNGFSPMPTAGQKIPDCDITRIKSWIDLGAPDN